VEAMVTVKQLQPASHGGRVDHTAGQSGQQGRSPAGDAVLLNDT
jgi:hypothetical protein